jgi:hypothetical protein
VTTSTGPPVKEVGTKVLFTPMVAAFGTGGARGKRKWQDNEFVESHPTVKVGGLHGPAVTITLNGQARIIPLEYEWTFGRRPRQRPWFRCSCGRRCRVLHATDNGWCCQPCSGYDYACRHRNRSCPAANRVGRVTTSPHRGLAREAMLARVEVAKSLHSMVRDLTARAKRGRRGKRSGSI